MKVWYNVTLGVPVVDLLMWYHITPGVGIVDLLLVSRMLRQA